MSARAAAAASRLDLHQLSSMGAAPASASASASLAAALGSHAPRVAAARGAGRQLEGLRELAGSQHPSTLAIMNRLDVLLQVKRQCLSH